MSIFKKLFGIKDSATPETIKSSVDNKITVYINPIAPLTNVSVDSARTSNTKIELSSAARIVGLDDDFINLIYFPDDHAKQKHRDNINTVLLNLEIKSGADFHKVQDKLIDYNNIDLNEPIPFLTESLLIEKYDIKKDSYGVTETKSARGKKGTDKIQGYYLASSFISINISLKLNSKQTDFSFEENLYNSYIDNSELNNFAKLNSTFSLGFAFFKANNIPKAELYFDKIEKGPFDLQPMTIAGFYRNIGELYADNSDKTKALKWLKAGQTLNPKLGVKKLITKIETDK